MDEIVSAIMGWLSAKLPDRVTFVQAHRYCMFCTLVLFSAYLFEDLVLRKHTLSGALLIENLKFAALFYFVTVVFFWCLTKVVVQWAARFRDR